MFTASLIAIFVFAGLIALLADEGDLVKERSDSVPCAECGRPTWSASGLCTVCRRPVAQRAPPTVREPIKEPEPRMPDLDAYGNIAEDIHCRQCGYNLRGLSPTGVCPECEMLNTRSLFGDMLRYSDPRWVRRLDNGMRLLLGAIFASIAGGILGAAGMMIFVAATGGAMPTMAFMGLFTALMTLVAFVWVAAVWMITTPDPGKTETEPPVNARTLARWCVIASIAAVPIGAIQQQGFAGGPMPGGPGATPATTLLDIILVLTSTLLGLIALVGTAAGIVYLRSLALRIPDDGIAQQTKIAGWGYVVVGVFGQLNALVFMLLLGGAAMAAGGLTVGMTIFTLTNCAVGLAALVFGVWMIVLLFRYAILFRKARERAESFAASQPLAA